MTTIPDTPTRSGNPTPDRTLSATHRHIGPIVDGERPDSVITWQSAEQQRTPRWPLLAVAAGITGLVANLAGMGASMAQDDPDPYVVVENLERGKYHLSFLFGLACATSLVILITALRDWVGKRGGDRLAARVIPNALAITASLTVISACMAGSLALYLPGGVDHGTMWVEGLMSSYFYLDFGALIAWWGVMLAAACSLPLSFGDDRVLPRWLGIVTVPLVALPAVAAAATGLPGLPGLSMPIWLVLFGTALVPRSK